ncbi:hypothetical protein M6B38_390110 [Iris pallida]|uniref:Uncharacterized protein n=1 Tax=Iris pallida TaxID=29817 RepID=A0AAX6G049_IRIPA|nr:hypothetical protein M6B38_390110 [Iris pallida]
MRLSLRLQDLALHLSEEEVSNAWNRSFPWILLFPEFVSVARSGSRARVTRNKGELNLLLPYLDTGLNGRFIAVPDLSFWNESFSGLGCRGGVSLVSKHCSCPPVGCALVSVHPCVFDEWINWG